MVENLPLSPFLPIPVSFEALARGFPCNLWYEGWSKKLKCPRYTPWQSICLQMVLASYMPMRKPQQASQMLEWLQTGRFEKEALHSSISWIHAGQSHADRAYSVARWGRVSHPQTLQGSLTSALSCTVSLDVRLGDIRLQQLFTVTLEFYSFLLLVTASSVSSLYKQLIRNDS